MSTDRDYSHLISRQSDGEFFKLKPNTIALKVLSTDDILLMQSIHCVVGDPFLETRRTHMIPIFTKIKNNNSNVQRKYNPGQLFCIHFQLFP